MRLNNLYFLFILFSCSEKVKKDLIRVEDDQLITKDEVVYFNNELFTGISFKLWNNGKMQSERSFNDGLAEGFSRGWYDNGQIMYEGTNKNGKEHGLWNHWYIDGKRNMEANFNNGVLDGQFKRWFDNGYLAYERIYSNGQLIEEKIPPHSKKTE